MHACVCKLRRVLIKLVSIMIPASSSLIYQVHYSGSTELPQMHLLAASRRVRVHYGRV
jgi:hypothetical protein